MIIGNTYLTRAQKLSQLTAERIAVMHYFMEHGLIRMSNRTAADNAKRARIFVQKYRTLDPNLIRNGADWEMYKQIRSRAILEANTLNINCTLIIQKEVAA